MSISEIETDIVSEGRLSSHPMIELLGALFASRKCGKLTVTHGKSETTIFAFNGIPINAKTTSPGMTIIDIMLQDKKLSPDDVMQVRQFARDKGLDQVDCARDLLDIGETQIYYYQTKAAKEIIIKSCGFRDGAYVFEESEECLAEIDMYDINPLEIIYEGMVRYHVANIANELYNIEDRKVHFRSDIHDHFLLPEPLYQHSDILDLFNEEVTAGQALIVMQNELGDINQAMYFLYLMVITGLMVLSPKIDEDAIIDEIPELIDFPAGGSSDDLDAGDDEFGDGSRDGADAGAKADESFDTGYVYHKAGSDTVDFAEGRDKGGAPDAGPIREVLRPSAVREPAAGGREYAGRTQKRDAEQAADEPAGAPDHSELRDRLESLESRFEAAEAEYEILGLDIDAGIAEIQEAYHKRMKLLDEDNLPGDLPKDLRKIAAKLRDRIGEAVAILADPDQRFQYETGVFEEEKARAWKLNMKKGLSRKMQQRGLWYLKHNSPGHARVFFQHAHNLDPEDGAHFMNLGWSIFRSNPGDAAEAISYLHSAIKVDSSLDKAHYYLGVIYKREGHNENAEKSFREALDINPGNASAQRELAFLTQHQKQKSLWSRIFSNK